VGSASATILSWITAEVDQALARVRERIARFVAEPEDTSVLAPCAEHLHQVAGALRMVGLAGATAFCESIEAGFERQEGARPSAATMAVLDRAVQALKEFVDGLERGQANVPLRLWPMYRELRALRGDEEPAEKDLFFPDLSLPAPAPAEPRALPPEELRPFVQAQRAQFQRGMLAMLKQQGGVQEMRQALDALHQVSAHAPDACALWWAAGALVDGMNAAPDAQWLQRARPVLHRLDLLMRDTAAGTAAKTPSLGSLAKSAGRLRLA